MTRTCPTCGAYANPHQPDFCMNEHALAAVEKIAAPHRDQIFGWTQMEQPKPREYVRFIAVSTEGADKMHFAIRDADRSFHDMTLPGDAAVEMAIKILEADRRRAQRENGLPETPGIRG